MFLSLVINDKILEYNNYDDIPQSFDNVKRFRFALNLLKEEEHEMETYNDKLKELLKREKR